MAGIKGKSRGLRANSGGRRPGAGRPSRRVPQPAATVAGGSAPPLLDAESCLRAVVEGRESADPVRVRAAATLIRYQSPQRRAPIENAAPRELQRRAEVAEDRSVVEDFEQRAKVIRAKFGR